MPDAGGRQTGEEAVELDHDTPAVGEQPISKV
jgi:hypothetical protein